MKREFTASTYIIHEKKVLLIFHHKLQKWLPPGGHIELNETPEEAAKREAKEETGLDIEFIRNEKITIDCWNAKTILNPFLTLLEEIPAYKEQEAHQHIDFVFLAKPHSGQLLDSCKWFSLEELQCLDGDVNIFKETLEVIEHIFNESM